MGATHRVTVRSVDGRTSTLHVARVHPDAPSLPLDRITILSVLSDSVAAAEGDGVRVTAATREAFTDEPDDDDAHAVIRSVRVLVMDGAAPDDGVVPFAREDALIEVVARRTRLFAHLRPGLEWDAAPLYPELEGTIPTGRDDDR